MHDLPLVTTIAAAFTAARVLGLITQRLGLSPIVGYLPGGVAIGPHTPGFVGDARRAEAVVALGRLVLLDRGADERKIQQETIRIRRKFKITWPGM